MPRSRSPLAVALLVLPALACSSSSGSSGPMTDAQYRAQVVTQIRSGLAGDIAKLHDSAVQLQADAPTPAGRGWDATEDADALTKMKADWRNCRVAYEHIEGALAPLFPQTDNSIDARYDDFLAQLAGQGDDDAFDDQGVTGMHAIERILYSNVIPQRVVDFESTLPGYAPAAFPVTADQAVEFKTKLVARLVSDVATMQTAWNGAADYDVGSAFQGLISLVNEQKEKVNKAATGEEESRYAQTTLFDLRNNLEGTENVYALFAPWVLSKTNASDPSKDGPTADAKLHAQFSALHALYDGFQGDAIPEPPPTWSSDTPTTADLQTQFGQLYEGVHQAVDPTVAGSAVNEMNVMADLLGFPEFKQQ